MAIIVSAALKARLRTVLSDARAMVIVLVYLYVGVEMILYRDVIAQQALSLIGYMLNHLWVIPVRW